MLRHSLTAMLVAAAAGLSGCTSYDAYPGYYAADVDAYSYPAYGPVVVPAPYPYTYRRHVYYPRYDHHGWEHRERDRRGWNANSLRNPAWPRGNYGPGHGAYHRPEHGRGAVSPGGIAGDR